MHDELPSLPTTDEPNADSTRSPADGPDDPRDESPATGPARPRSRGGVDPPDGAARGPSEDEPGRGDGPDCGDDPDGDGDDDECDEELLAYRLERLRLWRTLATLAVVVARLIRSL